MPITYDASGINIYVEPNVVNVSIIPEIINISVANGLWPEGGIAAPITDGGGLPSGGTSGQILSKINNEDYEVEWSSGQRFGSWW